MKKLSLTGLVLLLSISVYSQWQDNGTNSTTSDNIGIGGTPASRLDVGNFVNGSISNEVVLRLRNTVAQNQGANWGSAIEFYNMSNNITNANLKGAKIISEASQYGWSHNLKFRVFQNNGFQNQIATDALIIKENGNVGISGSLDVGTLVTSKLDIGNYQNGSVSTQVVLRLRNTVAENQAANWGSAIEFYNMSNNITVNNLEGAKIISEASQYGWSHNLKFRVFQNNAFQNQIGIDAMTINTNGDIGIGTSTPDSKLTVAGDVHSREVKVTVNAGADFVFEDSYDLRSLEQTESFIKENKHLPEIASANDMVKGGLELGEMNIKLLQKIEEITLYLIDQNKKLEAQQAKIEELEKKITN
ncbi:MAG: hypothetical protein ABJH72_03265 [Reichenbachiella sp.]|uniref:hypothetical protein n=1 Tax=Reichenbachiella sp. TaxID=2184521 RepID=UPI003298B4E4